MITVKDIYDYIDEIAPFSLQESYDNSGLIIGNMRSEVSKVLTALDVTNEIADEAIRVGAQLIVTHHPIIFRPVRSIDTSSHIAKLIANGISVIAAHTSFDSALLNDVLCGVTDLLPQQPLHVENGVKCGYVCCCDAVSAPVIARELKNSLGCSVVRYNDCGKSISKIAVCSGSGGDFLPDAIAHGCDAFITGDVKHSVFIDAHNAGITVFDAGHFHTENIFCDFLAAMLSEKFSDISCAVAESGRDILTYEV